MTVLTPALPERLGLPLRTGLAGERDRNEEMGGSVHTRALHAADTGYGENPAGCGGTYRWSLEL
jgi:hypothetical protein